MTIWNSEIQQAASRVEEFGKKQKTPGGKGREFREFGVDFRAQVFKKVLKLQIQEYRRSFR